MKKTPIEAWIKETTGLNFIDSDALEKWQLEKLKEAISYVKERSGFYQSHLNEIDVEKIHSIEDFYKLPFTQSGDIQKDPYRFLCIPKSQVQRIVTLNTTGTSGSAKRIFFSDEDMEKNLMFFKVGMSCLVDKEDRVLVLLPGEAFGSIGDFLKRALGDMGIPCFVEGILKDIRRCEEIIEREGITCLVGIPSQIRYFSRESTAFGRNIQKVLLSTDYVPETLIKELWEKNGCQVFTHYGMTEMGYGAAVECEAFSGYHLRECDLYFEIIDQKTGEPVKEGQMGEVVFSTMGRAAMPLLRYRTGDLASIVKDPCVCGTFLRRMTRVQGRAENRVLFSNGKSIYMRELDELISPITEIIEYGAIVPVEEELHINASLKDIGSKDITEKLLNEKLRLFLDEKGLSQMELCILFQEKEKPESISNSTYKRKIMDSRQGFEKEETE